MSDAVLEKIIATIRPFHPDVQAIYLFGSFGTELEDPESDVDLAVLLPPESAKENGSLMLEECWTELSGLLGREVDMINLRRVSTVFQNEIVNTARLILETDVYAIENFEMIAWSLYQKLNEERAGILDQIRTTGRIYEV